MSAYMVDRNHIRYLVSAAKKYAANSSYGFSWFFEGEHHKLDAYDRDQASKLGQILWDANLKSINARYPDTVGHPKNVPGPVDEQFVYAHVSDFPMDEITPVQLLKSIQCLEYQSNEYDEWGDSEAFVILENLKSCAIHSLPGYDSAAWGSPRDSGRKLQRLI